MPPSADGRLPTGILAVREFDPDRRVALFDEATLGNRHVGGLALRIAWRDVEPRSGELDTEVLDALFAQAEAHGKWVCLIPVAGFGSPAWVVERVRTHPFAPKYGRGRGEEARLPIPWDEGYLALWFDFLTWLGERYGDRPELRMIAAGGPTSVSSEMSLPNEDPDIEVWIRLGYRPSLYVAAWRSVFRHYALTFERQHFSLALYPGLPVNELGRRDPSERERTRQAVIDAGLQYPTQFVLQTSGLHAGAGGGGGFEIVKGLSSRIVTGFQLSTSATRDSGKMGDEDDPVNALRLTIDKGLSPGPDGGRIRYLQIYEADVLQPDMQGVIADAARVLR